MLVGIAMFGLLMGLFIAVAGWQSKTWGVFGAGVLICGGGMFVGVYGTPSRDMPNGSPEMTMLGTVAMIAGVIVLVWQIVKVISTSKQKTEARLLEIGGTPLDKFFVECVLASYNDFSQEKNVAKAKLLADKYGLKYPNGIQALYRSGLEAHKAISGQIDSDRISKMRSVEKAEYDRLNRYASFYGKDKRIAMLTDKMNELRETARSLDKGAEMLMRSGQQREIDWATWGGFANGIAGPAAGIATAVDIQAKNAQIRAENEARRRSTMPAYMSVTGSASQNRSQANAIEKELQVLREKLIADTSADDVMKMLAVSNITIEVSETGACVITAKVSAKSKLYIYDDVPAVADGSIVAHISEDGQEIGTAYMVFPVNGIADSTGLVGILLSGAHQGKKQTVTFTAGKLWLLEK